MPASSKAHKRQISAASTTVTRVSKRIRKSTDDSVPDSGSSAKKSKYFEKSENESEDEVSTPDATESGYEDTDENVSTSDPSEKESEEDEFESDEDQKSRRKTPKQRNKMQVQSVSSKNDLWREGVKTGLGPGKQVFIAKPKPRGDGGIRYLPEKIHPNTMEFLSDLKKNNDREWLKAHDPDYRQSWKDWESFVETLTEKIAEIDETIPELPPKDLVFRIYRDVRFSSDPTPYKPHFSAAWSRTGRKGPYACYYVQIQPGGRSFVGSGLWQPDAAPLALMRTNIDQHPDQIKGVLLNDDLRKRILGGVGKDEKKAVKAFASQNAENALKTKPKGYGHDHPNIELLRLRNFTIGSKLQDQDVIGPKGIHKVLELIKAMHPFVTYLNSVIMPDETNANPDSDSVGSDGNDEDSDQSVTS